MSWTSSPLGVESWYSARNHPVLEYRHGWSFALSMNRGSGSECAVLTIDQTHTRQLIPIISNWTISCVHQFRAEAKWATASLPSTMIYKKVKWTRAPITITKHNKQFCTSKNTPTKQNRNTLGARANAAILCTDGKEKPHSRFLIAFCKCLGYADALNASICWCPILYYIQCLARRCTDQNRVPFQ